jgi:hypothetical protein
LYAGIDALWNFYNSHTNPLSQLFHIAHTVNGGFFVWLMGVAGLAVILDVLINDWTPDFIKIGSMRIRLAWQKAFRYRHLFFVALAFSYAAQPYVADQSGYGVSLVVFFYINALENLAIAFFDARQRLRSPGWQRAN